MSDFITMLTRTICFVRACYFSRIAWILSVLHAAWFLLAIANMSPPSPELGRFFDEGGWSSATILAGRPFHFTYESPLLKTLIVADLPASLVSIPVSIPVTYVLRILKVGSFVGSYVDATIALLTGCLQWLILGKLAQDRLEPIKNTRWFFEKLDRYFLTALLFIAAFTAFTVPIVNSRSRQEGFRHPAISFH